MPGNSFATMRSSVRSRLAPPCSTTSAITRECRRLCDRREPMCRALHPRTRSASVRRPRGNLPMFRSRRLTAVMWLCLATTLIMTCARGWAQGEPAPRRSSNGRTLPLTNFYDTKPLPAGGPGQLIRSEATYDYLLSPEIRTVRILYHSRSANGDDVAVSGVVLLPDRAAPAAGWPVIA
jgi:hypothetical protein